MTIQEQANALLAGAESTRQADELIVRLAQDREALLKAARGAVEQFNRIKRRQHELLVLGQSFASASENWDEATMGQFIDFDPLMDAIAQAERPR